MALRLTPKQEEVVFTKSGLFAVRACPGSGKTFIVAARLNRLLTEWKPKHQGIATISFTNVACEEIEEYLVAEFGRQGPVTFPHFLGTIDSFINNYIFLPFGHLAMGCDRRPVLCGPPHDDHEPIGSWLYWRHSECNRRQCKLNEFSYDDRGQIARIRYGTMGQVCAANPSHPCVRYKKRLTAAGYATQPHANDFALQVLTAHPGIGKALVERFPFVMIDEAQDTSSTQMAIVDLLIASGCREVMLVGDADQAIYEWREARPHLFLQKCDQWRTSSVTLSENWRSTRRICAVLSRLCSSSEEIVAANPDLDGKDVAPEVWGYADSAELSQLFCQFLEKSRSCGIEREEASVLARGKELLNEVEPGSIERLTIKPWRDWLTASFARSRYLLDCGHPLEGLRILQKALCRFRLGKQLFDPADLRMLYREIGFAKWRGWLSGLLLALPSTDLSLSEWIGAANTVLHRDPALAGVRLGVKRDTRQVRYGELRFDSVFGTACVGTGGGCYLGTVHSVKGKSLRAVMLVLKKKAGQSSNYVNLLKTERLANEELRILYVALSRAIELLVVAVPKNDVGVWRERLGL